MIRTYIVITFDRELHKYITHLETNDYNEAYNLHSSLKRLGELSFIDYKDE